MNNKLFGFIPSDNALMIANIIIFAFLACFVLRAVGAFDVGGAIIGGVKGLFGKTE